MDNDDFEPTPMPKEHYMKYYATKGRSKYSRKWWWQRNGVLVCNLITVALVIAFVVLLSKILRF